MAKKKRKRVSPEDVRKNAAEGGGGGSTWFNLPDGVEVWTPDKSGTYLIDILPYEVAVDDHPDRVEKGVLWFKRQFAVHHNFGIKAVSVVCPRSIDKRCPTCDDMDALKADDYDKNEEQIKALKPQKYVMYNIKHPEEDDKIAIFTMSYGKFAKGLDEELKESDEDILSFFDVTDEGKTIKVRFSDATFMGRDYIEATRFDFKDRDEMDEDEILDSVACLDTILNVMPFDKFKDAYLQIDANDDDDGDKDKKPEDIEPDDDSDSEAEEKAAEAKAEKKAKAAKSKAKKEAKEKAAKEKEGDEDPDDDDDDGDSNDEDTPEPEPKEDKKKSKKSNNKDDDDDDDTPECPMKDDGGVFGETVDKFKECDDCPHWQACEEASED